jgi:hypothetical protein
MKTRRQVVKAFSGKHRMTIDLSFYCIELIVQRVKR